MGMTGTAPTSSDWAAARQLAIDFAFAAGLELEEPDERSVVLVLPGKQKLKTTVLLSFGDQAVSVNAFVIRHPDENHAEFYRWLLERNRRIAAVAFTLDRLGDIYLVGQLPISCFDEVQLDRVLGAVLENADGGFNRLLELGFSTSIRREWHWRRKRGESTRNLEAFRHLAESADLADTAESRSDGG